MRTSIPVACMATMLLAAPQDGKSRFGLVAVSAPIGSVVTISNSETTIQNCNEPAQKILVPGSYVIRVRLLGDQASKRIDLPASGLVKLNVNRIRKSKVVRVAKTRRKKTGRRWGVVDTRVVGYRHHSNSECPNPQNGRGREFECPHRVPIYRNVEGWIDVYTYERYYALETRYYYELQIVEVKKELHNANQHPSHARRRGHDEPLAVDGLSALVGHRAPGATRNGCQDRRGDWLAPSAR